MLYISGESFLFIAAKQFLEEDVNSEARLRVEYISGGRAPGLPGEGEDSCLIHQAGQKRGGVPELLMTWRPLFS